MVAPVVDGSSPLSDEDYEQLAQFFDEHGELAFDGFLGLLHAVTTAPGIITPSVWLQAGLTRDARDAATDPTALIGLMLRCYNEVAAALDAQVTQAPDADDEYGCELFAAGYVRGAELDPEWIGNPERWALAAPMAYLGDRHELVSQAMLETMERDGDETRSRVCEQLGSLVSAAYEAFREQRRGSAEAAALPPPGA